VLIYDSRTQTDPQTIVAEEGVLIANRKALRVSLRLRNGSIHKRFQNSKNYQVIRFTTYEINLDTQSMIGAGGKLVRAGKNHSVYVIKEKLKRYGKKHPLYNDLLVEYHKKFALPAACLILGLVGAPLGVRNRRSGRSGGLALSLVIIVFYYVLLTLGEGLGDGGTIPPVIAVWIPNFALTGIGAYLTIKVQKDSAFTLAMKLGECLLAVWEALRKRFFPTEFSPSLKGGQA